MHGLKDILCDLLFHTIASKLRFFIFLFLLLNFVLWGRLQQQMAEVGGWGDEWELVYKAQGAHLGLCIHLELGGRSPWTLSLNLEHLMLDSLMEFHN